MSPPTFVVPVASTLEALLKAEDTDGDHKITIDDTGPKVLSLDTLSSNGNSRVEIRGTYALSNLLQELTAAQEKGSNVVTIDYARLHENPVNRLSRLIKDLFWTSLTRRMDAAVIETALKDTKDRSEGGQKRVYVPYGAPEHFEYYSNIAKQRPDLNINVIRLPQEISHAYYRDMLEKPGLLALDIEEYVDDQTKETKHRAVPFVVPGGRFNELYCWDSHFMAVGILAGQNIELAKAVVKNFIFEIQHYGLVPNANRSYYLLRSQPPFLTDLSLRLYNSTKETPGAKQFLKRSIEAAIKEYFQVWTSSNRYDAETGLSKYNPNGSGIPREVEAGHFDFILSPYAEERGLSCEEFIKGYNDGSIDEPDLETYFKHDRAVRESGHDVSSRFENVVADLVTIDLNSLLYKYETDIAWAIREVFQDKFEMTPEFSGPVPAAASPGSSAAWEARAAARKEAIDKYLWNEEHGIYFDYNTNKKLQEKAESVTTFWAMWCGVASDHQASLLVSKSLPRFECEGGLSTCSKAAASRHQWDYPYGWAPHQILAWDGLARYGYHVEAERVAYRWLLTIMKVFVGFNGALFEKYDVTNGKDPHKVDVEYGNQGRDFKGYTKEGFGWTNSSFLIGLTFLSEEKKKALSDCAPYEGTVKEN